MKKKIPIYPIWICHPCGEKHGNRTVGVATWHKNTCDICGDEASVTEPRDYGHLKDTWIKAAESRSGGQQNCKHCGSTEDFWWSRTEPMGYYCSDCGKEYEPERTMNTDTPRTDEVAWPETGLVEGDFARQLERELAAVTEQRDRLAEALRELLTTGDNGYGTPTDKAWEMAEQTLAAVEGGSR
jgi:hypothetical protein